MIEIFSRTSASEAGSWPSSTQLTSPMLTRGYALPNATMPRKPSMRFAVLCLAALEMVSHRPPSRRVSFPCPAQVRRWQTVLLLWTGSDFEAWRDWRPVLLCSPSELREVIALEGRVVPYTDPELERKPQCHARLVHDMSLRGLVSFGATF